MEKEGELKSELPQWFKQRFKCVFTNGIMVIISLLSLEYDVKFIAEIKRCDYNCFNKVSRHVKAMRVIHGC